MNDDTESVWDVGEQRERLSERTPTRRDVLAGSAKLGGGALALSMAGAGAGAAAGQDDGGEGPSDVDILNYALTLEKLEATLYARGLEMFSEDEFESTQFAEQFSDTLQFSTYNYFEAIRNHEQTHVEQLTAVIEQLDGEPVSGLEFEFPYENTDEYVALAQTAENLGVAAYAGVAPMIDSDEILAAALSIHSVEARHAGYLNTLNRKIPFPNAFDEAKSMDEVLETVEPFIVES
jgi:rubrerythrin